MKITEIKTFIMEDVDVEPRLVAINGTKKQLNDSLIEYMDLTGGGFDVEGFTSFMISKGFMFNFVYYNTY
jgi:hypothetical protein